MEASNVGPVVNFDEPAAAPAQAQATVSTPRYTIFFVQLDAIPTFVCSHSQGKSSVQSNFEGQEKEGLLISTKFLRMYCWSKRAEKKMETYKL